MRYYLLAFVLFLSLLANAQSVPAAEAVLKEASATAARESKNVFIIFHASWCGWCRKMDASMNDGSVKSFFDKSYVIRHLTVHESKGKEALENPGALELLEKYNGADSGIPYWLIFDKDGNLLADSRLKKGEDQPAGENTGCPASADEVAYFINVLRKTSSIKEPDLSTIAKIFRKNEAN